MVHGPTAHMRGDPRQTDFSAAAGLTEKKPIAAAPIRQPASSRRTKCHCLTSGTPTSYMKYAAEGRIMDAPFIQGDFHEDADLRHARHRVPDPAFWPLPR